MDETGLLYELSGLEVMRLDVDDEHYYYGAKTGEEKKYYMALTHVIDIAGPFPEGLRQYLRVTSYEEQKDRLQATGDRGSKLHGALEGLMNGKAMLKKDYPTTYEQDAMWTFRRMIRFLTPKNFETELIVADPDLRIAGTLDFKGIVDSWKLEALLDPIKYLELDSDNDLQLQERWLNMLPNNKKRVCIIIDWKFTGRNAYSHKVQVAAYKTMNNKSRKGTPASRAFTWRYSTKHKFGFDFSESSLNYHSFKRIYATCIEFLGEFPEPPTIRRYPDLIRLYESTNKKEENENSKTH